jgi:hypothetical protein
LLAYRRTSSIHKKGDVGSLATYSYRSQEEEMEWWSNGVLETERGSSFFNLTEPLRTLRLCGEK